MRITVEVTEEELNEMAVYAHNLKECIIEDLENGTVNLDFEYSYYGVHIKVVDKKVV